MLEITVPKLNSNDESYVLVEWLVGDGDALAPESPVAVVETSKTTEELTADEGGFLQQAMKANNECAVGTVIGRIFPTEEARLEYLAAAERVDDADTEVTDTVITRSAQDAARELGVDLADLVGTGKKVLKRRDVEEFAARVPEATDGGAREADADDVRLSPAQQAVGQIVTRSHRDIPAAFLAAKVPVDAALELQGRLAAGSAAGSPVLTGLPELLIKAVAGLRERFPLFFGTRQSGGTVSLVPGAHTGVTLDLGKGLYIPVIEHADEKSLAEIADILADFRISALRGSFRNSELAGGNITISLSNDADIVLARPIIFPGQTCMLCLCATQEELYRDSGGEIRTRRYANLGITYDHRVVNGRDAVGFLQAIRQILVNPDTLLA